MTPDGIVNFVSSIWPVYTNGDQVDVEVLPRAASCPVRGMVMWNKDAGRWVVFLDNTLTEPRSLLALLGHELGHIVKGHLGKTGDANSASVARDVFIGKQSLVAQLSRRHWQAKGQQAETQNEESEVNEFAAKFVRTWLPFMETLDEAIDVAVQTTLRRMEA